MERFTEYHCGVAVIKDKNLWAEAMKKLARLEDQEEAGQLLELPCKPGAELYCLEGSPGFYRIDTCKLKIGNSKMITQSIGKTVFRTRQEAEEIRQQLSGGCEK